MKHYLLLILLLFASSLFAKNSEQYLLGVGDEISIQVYDEPDLIVETIIGENGDISYPFLGNLVVVGKTTSQIREIITAGLKNGYLISPSVQVNILAYRPFYIHGEVNKPGGYPYKPGLKVDQAIALAGGLTDRAGEDKIYIKKEVNGEIINKKITIMHTISPGDTITIRQSFF